MLRPHPGGVATAPNPWDEVAALENEPLIYGADENCWNPSRKAKQQRDLLKNFFNHVGALAGQEDLRCEKYSTLETEGVCIYQSFSGLPNYSKNFNI